MGGASSYLAILAICGFLSAAWMATKASKMVGVSSIVAEIAVGVVLGPRIAGLISEEYAVCEHRTHAGCELPDGIRYLLDNKLPLGKSLGRIAGMGYCNIEDYEHAGRRLAGGGGDYATYEDCLHKSCNADVSHHCGLTPDAFTLIGHTGVALMIFESGMHFDFEKARVVGPGACVVAFFGTVLPFISGTILMAAYGYPMVPDGVAVGTALAPTSVGIALRLLGEAGCLQHDFGQAIITAAFVDDILSLILFNVLFSLRGEFNLWATVIAPIIGIIFMGVAMVGAVKFWPHMINNVILPKLPQKHATSKVSSNDEGLFMVMMLVLLAYATATHFLGTHLWGCFIAGMSFACVDHAGHKGHTHHVWVRQTKRYTSWMIRIFFSCTVAFSIPIHELMSFETFWKGSIMGLGPCVATKVFCAPFMHANRVIGWAMVGRAEFAYLIAQMANAANMIDEKTFSICIWALLYATILAPFVFRYVLKSYIDREGIETGPPEKVVLGNDDGDVDEDYDFVESYQDDANKVVHWEAGVVPATIGSQVDVEADGGESVEKTKARLKAAASGEPAPTSKELVEGTAEAAAAALASQRARRVWWGRQPPQRVAAAGNGFLCCLFFNQASGNGVRE